MSTLATFHRLMEYFDTRSNLDTSLKRLNGSLSGLTEKFFRTLARELGINEDQARELDPNTLLGQQATEVLLDIKIYLAENDEGGGTKYLDL